MTDSPDPKKRGKRSAKKKDDAPPPSDPTLSDRAAGATPNDEKEHDAEAFDVPVSGFFEGEKAENENHAADASAGDAASTSESESTPPPSSDAGNDDDDDFSDHDVEATVNLTGEDLPLPGRDDLEQVTSAVDSDELPEGSLDRVRFQQAHLRGAIEALVFASGEPLKANELAKRAHAPIKEVKEALLSLKSEYSKRGIHLDEIAGGWVFRTSPEFAPFVRELTKEKPVRLTRAQLETLAILAYRQPITRPEIDDIRGVDSGPVLKLLLERDLIRILGKKEEAGRPILYGTTSQFLEFFGLKSLKDLPTLTEFTELNEDSRRVVEDELGESLEAIQEQALQKQAALDLETTRNEELKIGDTGNPEDFEDPEPGAKEASATTEPHDVAEKIASAIDEELPTRELENRGAETDVADTAEIPHHLKNARDTFTNEPDLSDEELYPDDKDEDFDDDDDDDVDDDEDDAEEIEEVEEVEPGDEPKKD